MMIPLNSIIIILKHRFRRMIDAVILQLIFFIIKLGQSIFYIVIFMQIRSPVRKILHSHRKSIRVQPNNAEDIQVDSPGAINIGRIIKNYKKTQEKLSQDKQISSKKKPLQNSISSININIKAISSFKLSDNINRQQKTQGVSSCIRKNAKKQPIKTQFPTQADSSIKQQINTIDRYIATSIEIENQHQKDYLKEMETPKFALARKQEGKIYQFPKDKDQLIKSIKKLLRLQQKLRNLKHYVKPSEKEKVLGIISSKFNFDEDIVALDSQQFDPFFDHFNKQAHSNIQSLAQDIYFTYQTLDEHWNKNMKCRFNCKILADLLTTSNADEQKQVLSIRKIARFIDNFLLSQKYLKPRDVYRFYQRISPFTKDNFIKTLGSKI